jgi:hypothetical protein
VHDGCMNYGDLRVPDYVSGHPCCNCESYPRRYEDPFCSNECRAEYEGEGEYGE